MKLVKESISFERSKNSHQSIGIGTKEIIKKWLDNYNIKKYYIREDFTVDVFGNVILEEINIGNIPNYIKFNTILGSFVMSDCKLSSLIGMPIEVEKVFNISHNNIKNLEGFPKFIGKDIYIHNNKIEYLKEIKLQKIDGIFHCSNNLLTSLEGCPKIVKAFNCDNNLLTSLEGCPKTIINDGYFSCKDNRKQFSREEVLVLCNAKGQIKL